MKVTAPTTRNYSSAEPLNHPTKTMKHQKPISKPEPADPTEDVVGGDVPRLARLFRDENIFAGGHYTVEGIELSLPCGKLRIGRMIFPPQIKPPSIAYIGRRHTWTWTLRLWTVAVSYLPNHGFTPPTP